MMGSPEIQNPPVPKVARKVLRFLLALERALPPPEGRRHSLTVDDENRLVLFVWCGENWQSFFLEDEDLDKPNRILISEIEALLQEPLKTAWGK